LLGAPPISDLMLRELEGRLTDYLPVALDHLKAALKARPVGINDLPEDLRERWLSADGKARVEVRPAIAISDSHDLRRFAEAVQGVVPTAVGTPVIVTEAADVVSTAFVVATAIAVALVVLILLAVLRNIYDMLLVVLPLVLAAVLTSLTAVALGLALNFANIIALPLLFGLGVSSAIHVVLRWREEGRSIGPIPSSTSRSVLYSALTTVGAVGSLAISGHPGMVSMGYLLTIAIGYTLITTLFMLPSLIAWVSSDRSNET
jgi:predicted RND superfamily exporter protein